MKLENGMSNPGAVLLAQLKALVDSFPHQQRTDVIETLKIVFRGDWMPAIKTGIQSICSQK
jgi:hypothetical protein